MGIEIRETETAYQRRITCPYCGREDMNSNERGFESDGDEMEQWCCFCEKEFEVTFHVEVSYSTTKLKE